MSGHSHWATIKRKKGANDAKRGQLFSKLGREIAIAARDGADPENNVKLRLIVNKAKASGMPKDMIERTIRRGAGLDKDAAQFEELMYEGYGPHGIAMIVKVTTDNRNRAVSDIRRVFTRAGGNLAETGAVAWNFEQKGYISIPVTHPDPDRLFEIAVEAGADDVEITDDRLEIYTAPNELHAVSAALDKAGLKPETVELTMKPKQLTTLDMKDAQSVLQVVDQLEELEDVQQVYASLDLPEELVAEYEAQAA
ncbi:MAG TPA: YebC/PmpR family DNA-binding transcriptional regulator [Anaerolineae bacterium]